MPQKEDSLLEKAMKRFDIAADYYAEEYSRGQEDVEFAMGRQWPQEVERERREQGRPILTENRLQPFINNVVNQIRQARPTIIPKPVDSEADVDVAEVLRGIIKNIEIQSDAESAYDTAAYNAVSSGYGWLRVNTKYADYTSFEQEITIERICDPCSVYLDPSAQRLDGSDAEYAFICEEVGKEQFKELYPDAQSDGFKHGSWKRDDVVPVLEYFYKDYEQKTLVEYKLGSAKFTAFKEDVPPGALVVRERETYKANIKYCKMTSDEILEENDFPGRFIPVVPVYGLEAWLDGRRQVFSLIHQAKDPQKMFNYWKTISTEVVALQPKAPWVGAVGQFASTPSKWSSANRVNHAVLEYDIIEKNGVIAPPPQRQAPPTGSMTMLQEAMSAADGIKAALGMYDASMGQNTPDISGKAIISRQMQGDLATFHFVDNLSTAMKHVGRILVDLIPRIYSGQRMIRINGQDGQERMIALGVPVVRNGKDFAPVALGQKPEKTLKLDLGKYDVVIEVGSSYATRRQETANALIELAKGDPRIVEVGGDIIVENLDFPGASDLAKRIRAVMPPEVLGDDVEAQRLQQLSEALQQVQEKLTQTETALQLKEDDKELKRFVEKEKLELERQKIELDRIKTLAEVQRIEAEARIGIPAEAMSDIAAAGAELEIRVEQIGDMLEELLRKGDEEASGEPNESPEQEKEGV